MKSDPFQMINMLSEGKDFPWHLRNLRTDFMSLANSVKVTKWPHAPRTMNSDTHQLAYFVEVCNSDISKDG